MFFKIRLKDKNTAEDGRPVADHWREHISWCIETLRRNGPDTPEIMEHMHNTCASWVGRSKDDEKFFRGDASYNAFGEIVARPRYLWEKYCTPEQKSWLESFDQQQNGLGKEK